MYLSRDDKGALAFYVQDITTPSEEIKQRMVAVVGERMRSMVSILNHAHELGNRGPSCRFVHLHHTPLSCIGETFFFLTALSIDWQWFGNNHILYSIITTTGVSVLFRLSVTSDGIQKPEFVAKDLQSFWTLKSNKVPSTTLLKKWAAKAHMLSVLLAAWIVFALNLKSTRRKIDTPKTVWEWGGVVGCKTTYQCA